jgi:hypothetical protein
MEKFGIKKNNNHFRCNICGWTIGHQFWTLTDEFLFSIKGATNFLCQNIE